MAAIGVTPDPPLPGRLRIRGQVTVGSSNREATVQGLTPGEFEDVSGPVFFGLNVAGPAAPFFMNQAESTAILNLFTAGLQGLVPASGGGTANFLRADGNFVPPPGGGTTFIGEFNSVASANSPFSGINFLDTADIAVSEGAGPASTMQVAFNLADVPANSIKANITSVAGPLTNLGVASNTVVGRGGGDMFDLPLTTNSVLGRTTGSLSAQQSTSTNQAFIRGTGSIAWTTAGSNTVLGRDGTGALSFGSIVNAQVTLNTLQTDRLVQVIGNTLLANPTALTGNILPFSVNANSVVGRFGGDLANLTAGSNSAMFRGGGSLFFGAAGVNHVLRRPGAGSLAFGLISGTNIDTNTIGPTNQATMLQARIKGRARAAGTGDEQDMTGETSASILRYSAAETISPGSGGFGLTLGESTTALRLDPAGAANVTNATLPTEPGQMAMCTMTTGGSDAITWDDVATVRLPNGQSAVQTEGNMMLLFHESNAADRWNAVPLWQHIDHLPQEAPGLVLGTRIDDASLSNVKTLTGSELAENFRRGTQQQESVSGSVNVTLNATTTYLTLNFTGATTLLGITGAESSGREVHVDIFRNGALQTEYVDALHNAAIANSDLFFPDSQNVRLNSRDSFRMIARGGVWRCSPSVSPFFNQSTDSNGDILIRGGSEWSKDTFSNVLNTNISAGTGISISGGNEISVNQATTFTWTGSHTFEGPAVVLDTVTSVAQAIGFVGVQANSGTGQINNLSLNSDTNVIRFTGPPALLTGMASSTGGQVLLMVNASTTADMLLGHSHTSSLFGNRFLLLNNTTTVELARQGMALAWKDTTSGQWRVCRLGGDVTS